MKVALVIPVRNAGKYAALQIAAIRKQSFQPTRLIVLDSESVDGSSDEYRRAGYEVVRVSAREFDHGGTRNLGLSLASEVDFLMYLTQDALPYHRESMQFLLDSFGDTTVAVAYGRQLARSDSSAIEQHARLFNYPDQSNKRSIADAERNGIRVIFTSNSFAAYRREALSSIGGFPERTIMGEDQVSAGRLLLAGWRIAYIANAAVIHSHSYGLVEEFQRYFDIGVFHSRNREVIDLFPRTHLEGCRFIKSECKFLVKHAPACLPEAWLRTIVKLIGFRLGKGEAILPPWIARRLAMNSQFFR